MSDDPPGLNSPRRKARFSSRYEQEVYRRRASQTPDAEPIRPIEELPPETESASAASIDEAAVGEPGGLETPGVPTTADEGGNEDLLPNFRLNKVYDSRPTRSNPLTDWRWLALAALLLALGLGGGYALGLANAPATTTQTRKIKEPAKAVFAGLSAEVQAQVDEAFQAMKKGSYTEARVQFDALRRQHPEWWSMTIESGRASLYLRDVRTARQALSTLPPDQGQADANFLSALLHLTNKELELAENSFAIAVAHDPARPDFYYFWGECLRRDGKPLEAVGKFRAALLRNQYENSEGLYQFKLWLSQIQADQEEVSGTNKAVDEALATPRPPYEALLAAAAREMKAGRYPQAVDFIRRARAITEPAVFRVIMQDATFTEEVTLHPEIKAFYQ